MMAYPSDPSCSRCSSWIVDVVAVLPYRHQRHLLPPLLLHHCPLADVAGDVTNQPLPLQKAPRPFSAEHSWAKPPPPKQWWNEKRPRIALGRGYAGSRNRLLLLANGVLLPDADVPLLYVGLDYGQLVLHRVAMLARTTLPDDAPGLGAPDRLLPAAVAEPPDAPRDEPVAPRDGDNGARTAQQYGGDDDAARPFASRHDDFAWQ